MPSDSSVWLPLSMVLCAAACIGAGPSATRRVDQVDLLHGVRIADPYRWLEDLDSAETRRWIEAQNRHTESWLSQSPERDALRNRLSRLYDVAQIPGASRYAPVARRGGKYFVLRREGLANQPMLLAFSSLDGTPRVVLDPNQLAGDGTLALANWSVSENGRYVAYGLSSGGSDWQEFRVRDVETGKDLADTLRWIKFSSANWSPDHKGFYYTRFPQPEGNTLTGSNYFNKVYYHRLGEPQSSDTLVYERPDHKDWRFSPSISSDGRFLLIRVLQGTREENIVFYQDLKAAPGKVLELVPQFEASFSPIGEQKGRHYFVTSWNAPKRQIISVDLTRPDRANWKVVVPEGAEKLEEAALYGDVIAAEYLKDATSRVRLFRLDGAPAGELTLPGVGDASLSVPSGDSSEYLLTFTSFTVPSTLYRYDSRGRTGKPLFSGKTAFDPTLYETSQVFYSSKDGTRIPMFLVHRKGLKRDGSNPTLLYAYGGFNVAVVPGYSSRFAAWCETGGILAVANLRGGGEYGEAWHRAGMLHNKQTVFDDFVAAAEWLIGSEYTSSRRLAIYGGSNGGLLVGAVLNQRPELFGAAVPAVGVMDMLRFHKFTVGAAWISEYGSPDKTEDFRVLQAYSPLHNIRETNYPATMATTGDHDDRVVPSHSFKYAAALQAAQRGDAPILIRIATKAGHGAGKPTSKRIEEDADVIAFLRRALGVAERLH